MSPGFYKTWYRMAYWYSLLLFILSLVHGLNCSPVNIKYYYVRPNSTISCPNDWYQCHTLDEYVQNWRLYNSAPKTTFEFLDGTHHLSRSLTSSYSDYLHLRAFNGSTATVSICATYNGGKELQVKFDLSSKVALQDLTFQNCLHSPESMLEVVFSIVNEVILSHITFRNLTSTLILSVSQNFTSVVLSHVHFDRVKPLNVSSYLHFLPSLTRITCYKSNKISVKIAYMVIGGSPIPVYGISVYMDKCRTSSFEVLNSHISDCHSIGMVFYDSCDHYPGMPTNIVTIQNTVFIHNAVAILFLPSPNVYSWSSDSVSTQCIIINSTFENNGLLNTTDGTVVAYRVRNVTVTDCIFRHNIATAMIADQSFIYFYGETIFFNNTGYKGGALALYQPSIMWFWSTKVNSTKLIFESNTALYAGGAIYVSPPSYREETTVNAANPCFIQILISKKTKLITFFNNSALNGGDDLYGGALDQKCSRHSKPLGGYIEFDSEFSTVTDIRHNSPNHPSVISSDPALVCLCVDSMPTCDHNNTLPIQHVYPGQYFNFPVALVGDMNGLVRGPIYAQLAQKPLSRITSYSLVDELQKVQETNAKNCTRVGYAIKALPVELELHLAPHATLQSNAIHDLKEGVLKINITIHSCPLGFDAEGDPPICLCNKLMKVINITCNITEEVIYRQGRNWVGHSNDTNTTAATLLFSKYCPSTFCRMSQVALYTTPLDLLNEAAQCNHNRSGILCGQCQPAFSLAIGSTKCVRNCTYRHLALLIVFAGAGVALVFLIKILNLTVTQGTINGFIFYANIANCLLNYPTPVPQFDILTKILNVFISWVNLDFGIESCFFYGLDAYIKSWLQFVFPMYILGIALLIIVISHYSVRASRLLGGNAVPVLATLTLLSYTKLLRTVLSAFTLTRIKHLDSSETTVWQEDGSVEYLKGKHIPLFLVSVVALVLLLPFTLLLLFYQWLQKVSHYQMLQWITRLKPFFDAYMGPFKDKYRYWVGALLLVRCVLLLVFFFTPTVKYSTTLTTTVFLVAVCLVLVGQVYRNSYFSALECFYHLNLVFLAVGMLYTQQIGQHQEALVDTLVGIACLQFILTVIYHICITMRRVWRRMRKNGGQFVDTLRNLNARDTITDFAAGREFEDSNMKFRETLFEHLLMSNDKL